MMRNTIEQKIIKLNKNDTPFTYENIIEFEDLLNLNPNIKSIALHDVFLKKATINLICFALCQNNTIISVKLLSEDAQGYLNITLNHNKTLLHTHLYSVTKYAYLNDLAVYLPYKPEGRKKDSHTEFNIKCDQFLALDLNKCKILHASKIKQFRDDLNMMIEISPSSEIPDDPKRGYKEYYMKVDAKLDQYWYRNFTLSNLLFKSINIIDERGMSQSCEDICYKIAQFLKPGDIKHPIIGGTIEAAQNTFKGLINETQQSRSM